MNGFGQMKGPIINRVLFSVDYIRHENIKSSFPYLSKLDMVEIKGDVLMEALELSASSYVEERPNGANLQVSGKAKFIFY